MRARSPAKTDQVTTPLNGNITPRSGARRSRIGTESPSTPAPVKGVINGQTTRLSPGSETPKQIQGLGLSSPRLAAGTNGFPKVGISSSTLAITTHRRVSATRSMVEGSKDVSSKFFHADEAKSTIGAPGIDESPRYPPVRGHFFVGSPPLPQPSRQGIDGKEDPDTKFFRANEIPQSVPPKRQVLPHIPTEKLNGPLFSSHEQVQDANRRLNQTTPPQSPNKALKMRLAQPNSPQKIQLSPIQVPADLSRASSERPKSSVYTTSVAQADPSQKHRKSTSAGSITATNGGNNGSLRMYPPQPLDLRLSPTTSPQILGNNILSPDTLSPRSFSLTSTNTVPTSVTSETDSSEVMKTQATLGSVSEPSLDNIASPIPSQNDNAATARRERKVLDLEISNSSLLAINKTLERELRKQGGELRRYRRLSRSGRLSLATTRTASGQSAYSLGTLTELEDEDHQLSDLDEDSDLDDFDDEDDSLVSNDSGSLTSLSARSRQRARDEKRLLLDLSKHQQLLVDSQKLSQSIKRCMTCTDELIREGNKALVYRVGIGDIKLGGRVLNDDEVDQRGFASASEEPEARQGLLSPSLAKANMNDLQHWASPIAREPTGIASLEELTAALESVVPEPNGD